MDLRILKTKKAIRQAFFTIRARTPLEKVKVVELCNEAMINKTTFYKYYEDVFSLSAELEREFFESFWEDFRAKDLLLTDTAAFINELPRALDEQKEAIWPLYHDRSDSFFTKLEWELMKYYVPWDGPRDLAIRRSFFLCGVVRMLREIKENQNFTVEELAREMDSLVKAKRPGQL